MFSCNIGPVYMFCFLNRSVDNSLNRIRLLDAFNVLFTSFIYLINVLFVYFVTIQVLPRWYLDFTFYIIVCL